MFVPPTDRPLPPDGRPTLLQAWRMIREAQIGSYGAQAAFFVLLSAIPFFGLFGALLRYLPRESEDFFRWLPEGLAALLPERPPSVFLLSASAVTALWSASRGILALTRGLNRMFDRAEGRNYFLLRLYALAETLVLELALLCAVGGAGIGGSVGEIFSAGTLWGDLLRAAVGWGMLTGLFLFLYLILPDCISAPKAQLPGAAGAALGWILFTRIFSVYAERASHFPRIYGALSNAALLMLWLWVCLCIFLLGARINKLLSLL